MHYVTLLGDSGPARSTRIGQWFPSFLLLIQQLFSYPSVDVAGILAEVLGLSRKQREK
jgi:hypothetical protein